MKPCLKQEPAACPQPNRPSRQPVKQQPAACPQHNRPDTAPVKLEAVAVAVPKPSRKPVKREAQGEVGAESDDDARILADARALEPGSAKFGAHKRSYLEAVQARVVSGVEGGSDKGKGEGKSGSDNGKRKGKNGSDKGKSKIGSDKGKGKIGSDKGKGKSGSAKAKAATKPPQVIQLRHRYFFCAFLWFRLTILVCMFLFILFLYVRMYVSREISHGNP